MWAVIIGLWPGSGVKGSHTLYTEPLGEPRRKGPPALSLLPWAPVRSSPFFVLFLRIVMQRGWSAAPLAPGIAGADAIKTPREPTVALISPGS